MPGPAPPLAAPVPHRFFFVEWFCRWDPLVPRGEDTFQSDDVIHALKRLDVRVGLAAPAVGGDAHDDVGRRVVEVLAGGRGVGGEAILRVGLVWLAAVALHQVVVRRDLVTAELDVFKPAFLPESVRA